MATINKNIKALLHPAGGHQGSHKAHQAGNQPVAQAGIFWALNAYNALDPCGVRSCSHQIVC